LPIRFSLNFIYWKIWGKTLNVKCYQVHPILCKDAWKCTRCFTSMVLTELVLPTYYHNSTIRQPHIHFLCEVSMMFEIEGITPVSCWIYLGKTPKRIENTKGVIRIHNIYTILVHCRSIWVICVWGLETREKARLCRAFSRVSCRIHIFTCFQIHTQNYFKYFYHRPVNVYLRFRIAG
jgi:hypothetical protein